MRETDVLVVGGGESGMEAARAVAEGGLRALVLDKAPRTRAPPARGVDAEAERMVLDVILSPEGRVAGALVVHQDANEVRPYRARAVVLATGGVSALWPRPVAPTETGDGYALAHRAGATLEALSPALGPLGVTVKGGVACDAAGETDVPGLFVAGEVSARRLEGARVGAAAADRAPPEFPPFGEHAVMPNIDSPLPRGFAQVKFERLQGLMLKHFHPTGARDVAEGLVQLHRLKGEADEFSRARVDPDLLSLRNACEVALILARGLQPGGSSPPPARSKPS